MTQAIGYFRTSCNDRDFQNTMAGFSCWQLATALLSVDFLGNYDEAMTSLDRACALQNSTCSTKSFYQGSGRVPSETPPKGAVGYSFGISSAAASAVCTQQGGRFQTDTKTQSTCGRPTVAALKDKPFYISLSFCEKDSLCDVTVALEAEGSDFFARYLALKKQLTELYGTPSRITVKSTPACRTVAVAPRCLDAGDAEFSTAWVWNEKGMLMLHVVGTDDSVGIIISYSSPEKVAAMGSPGL